MGRLIKYQEVDWKALYLDHRWQKKRLEILDRDNFTCQRCGATKKTLHVHHIYYTDWAEGPWDYEDCVLLTVCDDCHKEEHNDLPSSREHIFAGLVQLGFNTTEKFSDFGCFLETVRMGCIDPDMRQIAIDFLVSLWEKHGAFEGKNNEANS